MLCQNGEQSVKHVFVRTSELIGANQLADLYSGMTIYLSNIHKCM